MRTIKFRGLGENGWVYGDLFSAWAVGGIHPRIHWVEGTASKNQGVKPETVGQFTGLLDKEGIEIYEGDMLKYYHTEKKQEYIGVVTWQNYSTGFGIYPSFHKKREVIGNIYENPELLKEKR